MKYSLAKPGRIFIVRLEDGEILHQVVEQFAKDQGIKAAALIALGGADAGSKLVVGPSEGRASPIVPMETVLSNVHEITGTGTIFPDANEQPVLHMHVACGRESQTMTGCVRRGVRVWHVMEVIIYELTDTEAKRLKDPVSGFELLVP